MINVTLFLVVLVLHVDELRFVFYYRAGRTRLHRFFITKIAKYSTSIQSVECLLVVLCVAMMIVLIKALNKASSSNCSAKLSLFGLARIALRKFINSCRNCSLSDKYLFWNYCNFSLSKSSCSSNAYVLWGWEELFACIF